MKFELENPQALLPANIVTEDNHPLEEKIELDDKQGTIENEEASPKESDTTSLEENVNTPKDKYWSKLKKEREAKRELKEELDATRLEKAEMERMLRQSLNMGAAHYETAVASDLERAQGKLEIALEDGNAKDVAAATAEIARVSQALNEAQRATARRFPEEEAQYNVNDAANNHVQEAQVRMYEWFEANPELDKSTLEFDENLTKQVLPFITKLDNKMRATNKEYMIGSGDYYNLIDEYIDKLKSNHSNSVNKHFGSVRGKIQDTNVQDKRPRQLTLQEKKAAIVFGQTDEQYLKYLEKYEQELRGK